MFGYKDPGAIVAEIRMSQLVHEGAFLVVEGISDMRFWRTRKFTTCELVNGEGKTNVVNAVRRLDVEQVGGVLGVVDDDYDSLMRLEAGSSNVVMTDAHDIECMLCRSSALEMVLAEYGDQLKIARFEDAAGVDVRTGLLERALIFGRLRWAARRRAIDINHDALRISRFISVKSWAVDRDGLVQAVVEGDGGEKEELWRRCMAELPTADPWRVAHGHDMVQILRIGLQRVLGSIGSSTGKDEITRVLRAAVPLEELESTGLCRDMRRWEVAEGHLVLQVR